MQGRDPLVLYYTVLYTTIDYGELGLQLSSKENQKRFCVDVTDGAQQCSGLQVIIDDIDGSGPHSCCAAFGCWCVGSFCSFHFHKERLTVHLLLHTHFSATHSCCAAFGCWCVGSFCSFHFHKERFTVHLLLHTHFYLDKKNTLVVHFCE